VYGSGNLTWHGGPIEHTPNVWLIFWGPNWNSDSEAVAARDVVINEFADLGHTRYENILSQYYDAAGSVAKSLTSNVFTDSSVPPSETTHCGGAPAVDDSSLQAEVNALISLRGLPHNDGNTTYLVFTEELFLSYPPLRGTFEIWDPTYGCSAPGSGNYCGYHSFDTTVNQAYAAIPYPDLQNVQTCATPAIVSVSSKDGAALGNTAAVEEAETITDPLGTGWYDSTALEVGSKCYFDFAETSGGYTYLNNGGSFVIQTLYSNASGQCANSYAADTIGVWIPGNPGYFCLRSTVTLGGCFLAIPFGSTGDIPVVGDWTGKGYDSIGVYIPGNPGYFCLRNTNTPGGCDMIIPFGTTGDIPVVGEWNDTGYDSIGVYIPGNPGYFCLRNTNTPGNCDMIIPFGTTGDIPVVGDWAVGDGFDNIGVYIPGNPGYFCLSTKSIKGGCDIIVAFGSTGYVPVVGDTTSQFKPLSWPPFPGEDTNAIIDTIGVWLPSGGYWCLRNSNVTGSCDVITHFGTSGDVPLVGNWFDEGAGAWAE
jgi:hypothetical protein